MEGVSPRRSRSDTVGAARLFSFLAITIRSIKSVFIKTTHPVSCFQLGCMWSIATALSSRLPERGSLCRAVPIHGRR